MTTYNYLDPTYLRERSIYVYFFYSKVILKVNLNMPKRSVDDIINDSLPVLWKSLSRLYSVPWGWRVFRTYGSRLSADVGALKYVEN